MKDVYKEFSATLHSSAINVLIVTPSDTNDLPFVSNGFWQIGSGSVRITTKGGDDVTLPALPEGTIGWYWPIFVTKIWATGTTATAIVAGTA